MIKYQRVKSCPTFNTGMYVRFLYYICGSKQLKMYYVVIVCMQSLFRNKRFLLDEMLHRNASSFATFLEYTYLLKFLISFPNGLSYSKKWQFWRWRPWAKSSLSSFAQKYLRKWEETYFILQNKYLRIYKDRFGVKILGDDSALYV